ncbi:hypothetical protein D3C81_1049580 [compost metagenome]
MFVAVQVHHKVNERTFEASPQPFIKSKPRTGHLRCGFKIKNSEVRCNIPMRFRSKLKVPRLTPTANFDIIFFRSAYRYACMRDVRNGEHQLVDFHLKRPNLFVQLLDAISDFAHLYD